MCKGHAKGALHPERGRKAAAGSPPARQQRSPCAMPQSPSPALAGDRWHRAGDAAGAARCSQKHTGWRQHFGLRRAAPVGLFAKFVNVFGRLVGRVERRSHQAGRHHIDPDAPGRQVGGQASALVQQQRAPWPVEPSSRRLLAFNAVTGPVLTMAARVLAFALALPASAGACGVRVRVRRQPACATASVKRPAAAPKSAAYFPGRVSDAS